MHVDLGVPNWNAMQKLQRIASLCKRVKPEFSVKTAAG